MTSEGSPSLLERYQRLLHISRHLASTLDLQTLLDLIVDAAAGLCAAQAASILLYDPAKGELSFCATSHDEPRMRGLAVPLDGSLAGWIVTHRQPVMIADARRDPRHFTQISHATDITTITLMGVPLIANDQVVGALEVINKLVGEFTQEDQDLLLALGSQAAVAINNARLFQQSDLISELVHELRTPLTSISTAARLLGADAPEPVRAKMAGVIAAEIERLSDLTTAYLDLARLESGRVQFTTGEVDLDELLHDSADVMRARAAEQQVSLQVEPAAGLPRLYADESKLRQVIANLLSNAIKYNRPGGSVVLRAGATSAEDEVFFEVVDTGLGIPPASLPHLFEKFYRVPGTERTAIGTGLGLSISKRIVDSHRGRIEVDSVEGRGTTFRVYLPAAGPK